MPKDNNFLHSRYLRADPGERVRYSTCERGAAAGSPAGSDALGRLGQRAWDAGVRAVVLLYGSHVGADVFGTARLDDVGGLKRGYSRGIPGLESLLAAMRPPVLRPGDATRSPGDAAAPLPPLVDDDATKTALDALLHDRANFTAQYAAELEDGLSQFCAREATRDGAREATRDDARDGVRAIVVRRILWSSRHHHLGRMEGALALFHALDRLVAERHLRAADRILVIAHGHAGHLPALLSNLVAPVESSVRDAIVDTLTDSYESRAAAPADVDDATAADATADQTGDDTPSPRAAVVTAADATADQTGDDTPSPRAATAAPDRHARERGNTGLSPANAADGPRHVRELNDFIAGRRFGDWPAIDVVTLGTPIRYGWQTDGVGALLHVVNHRPIRPDGKRWLGRMELPHVVMELPLAAGGDYVHQLAVAGTDAVPADPWEAALNQTLCEQLEPFDGFERWLECARRVTRCPNDGTCLLVDYRDTTDGDPRDLLFGHACYTRLHTLLFQTQLIVDTLYDR